MKDVQRYELFGGIAPKNHAFSFVVDNLMTTEFSLDFAKRFFKDDIDFNIYWFKNTLHFEVSA